MIQKSKVSYYVVTAETHGLFFHGISHSLPPARKSKYFEDQSQKGSHLVSDTHSGGNHILIVPPRAQTVLTITHHYLEMDDLNLPKFDSWDGLEENELDCLKQCIQDIHRLQTEITKRAQAKRSTKTQMTKLDEEVARLSEITRAWGQRPRQTSPTTQDIENHHRQSLRRLYALVQMAIANPMMAQDEALIAKQQQASNRIGSPNAASGADEREVKEANPEADRGDPMDIAAQGMTLVA